MNVIKSLMLTGAGGNPRPSQCQLNSTLPSRDNRNWYHSHQIFTLGTLISFFLGLVLLGSVEFFICHSPAL